MKIYFLVISETLGLFIVTMTANDKHSLRNSGNLIQPIQMQLSKKRKDFSLFFAQFMKFKSNYDYLKKKYWTPP